MGFEPFQDMIQKAALSYGVAREFRAIRVCRAFQAIIPIIFNDNKEADRALAKSTFKEGILTIKVPNSVWANEVMIKRELILEATRNYLQTQDPSIKIKELKTQIH